MTKTYKEQWRKQSITEIFWEGLSGGLKIPFQLCLLRFSL